MKGLVVDASVAASWLLNEELTPTAEWVLNEMQAGTPILVPSLWLLEITNVLFNAERRKRITRLHRESALERIERLPFTIVAPPSLADLREISLHAYRHQLTAYDAEYLRVAKNQRLSLATNDSNLLAAAKREKVPVYADAN